MNPCTDSLILYIYESTYVYGYYINARAREGWAWSREAGPGGPADSILPGRTAVTGPRLRRPPRATVRRRPTRSAALDGFGALVILSAVEVALVGLIGAVIGALAGAVLTARLSFAGAVQQLRLDDLSAFARLVYEHHRDHSIQVAARLNGEPHLHLPVGTTEELARLRARLAIVAVGPAADAAATLLEHVRSMDGNFDETTALIDPGSWAAANKVYDDLLTNFEAAAARASGLGRLSRLLFGL
jgi:hypothetical protein